jgi:TrpR family trp operon transcriptional repressor
MGNQEIKISAFKELTEVLAGISSPADIEKFFMEILTENERKDLSLRWDLLKKLHRNVPQRVIASELGISLCRITRGSRILKSGDSIIKSILDSKYRPESQL